MRYPIEISVACALCIFPVCYASAQNFELRLQAFAPNLDSMYELSQVNAIEFSSTGNSGFIIYMTGGGTNSFRMSDIDSIVFSPDTAHTTMTLLLTNGMDTTYPVAAIDSIVIPPISVVGSVAPTETPDGLLACYPNPSSDMVRIRLTLTSPERIRLTLYDADGRRVKQFEEQAYPAGTQTIIWNGRRDDGERVPNGIYLLSLSASDIQESLKLAIAH